MTTHRFDLTHSANNKLINISADHGRLRIWSDLSAPSCLIVPNGGFSVLADRATFSSGGNLNFTLFGTPFSAPIGGTGAAELHLSEMDCLQIGWRWEVISRV
jgi:hypothetical protein